MIPDNTTRHCLLSGLSICSLVRPSDCHTNVCKPIVRCLTLEGETVVCPGVDEIQQRGRQEHEEDVAIFDQCVWSTFVGIFSSWRMETHSGPLKTLFCVPTDELLRAKDDLLSEKRQSLSSLNAQVVR